MVVGWCLGQSSKRSQAYCVPDPLCAGLGAAQALAVALDELCLLGSIPLGRWEWGPEDERREAKREESVPGAGRGGASEGGAGEPVVVEVGAATHGLVSPCHSLRVAEAGPRGAALMSRSSFPGRPWVHPGWWAAAGASG